MEEGVSHQEELNIRFREQIKINSETHKFNDDRISRLAERLSVLEKGLTSPTSTTSGSIAEKN